MDNTPESWKKYLKKNDSMIVKMANQMFSYDQRTAEDASSYVRVKLREDDCKLLCKFKKKWKDGKKGKEETFFRVHIKYRLLDFRRILTTHSNRFSGNDPDVELGKLSDPNTLNPEENLIKNEKNLLLDHMSPIFKIDDNEELINNTVKKTVKNLEENLKGKIKKEFKSIPIPDRIFLKKIYVDGLTIQAAGKELGWSKDKSYYRHRILLNQLREIIPKSDLSDLL